MFIVILNCILIFLIKVFDNMLGTSKTLLIQKNKSILASLTVVISQVIFYKLINIVNGDTEYMIYVIAIASGLGTYLALLICDKFSKDRTYVNIMLSDDKEAMIELRDFLIENKIRNLTTDAYNKSWEKTLAITAYAETKKHSRLIDEYLENTEKKFKRIIDISE